MLPVVGSRMLAHPIPASQQEAFLKDDDTYSLLAQGVQHLQGPVKYDMLHAQYSKVIANIGLADNEAGTALHIFRTTGNLRLQIERANKGKVSSWGEWAQSTKKIYYDVPLHNLPYIRCLQSGEMITRKSSSWAVAL